MNTVLLSIDGAHVLESLQQVTGKLEDAQGELMVDFTTVNRVDSGSLKMLEKAAVVAEGKAVKIVLCGVNSQVYKAMKLAGVGSRFTFAG